jgi:hypothetical protein
MKIRWVGWCLLVTVVALLVGAPGEAFARNDQQRDMPPAFEGDPSGGMLGAVDIPGGGGAASPPQNDSGPASVPSIHERVQVVSWLQVLVGPALGIVVVMQLAPNGSRK